MGETTSTCLLALGCVAGTTLLPLVLTRVTGRALASVSYYLLTLAVAALGWQLAVSAPEVLADGLPALMWALAGFAVVFGFDWLVHSSLHRPGESCHCHDCEPDNGSAASFLGVTGLHLTMDGALIAAGFMASPETGWGATLAVIAHEAPKQFGAFGYLTRVSRFEPRRAVLANLMVSVTALGAAAVAAALLSAVGGGLHSVHSATMGGMAALLGRQMIPSLLRADRPWKLGQVAAALAVNTVLVGAVSTFFGGQSHH